MMHDNLDPQFTGESARPAPERAERRDESVGDREVPVVAMPAVVHAWLDGEPVNQSELQAAPGFATWNRVQGEMDRRRRMRTPTPIAGAIMEAIRKG
jgi:hypothetical protein